MTESSSEFIVQRRYPPTEGTPKPGWSKAGASTSSKGGNFKRLAYAVRAAETALDEYRGFNERNTDKGNLELVRRIEYRVIDSAKTVLWESSTDKLPIEK
ncbi:hypothetical protein E3T28_07090 [Cryobacterium sinapicolor]|uniref:Uncharacterized protein n=1 Tax=Cryobacterium sinapicolor TaxID=1259236 RepID=A0ABY2JB90_9MICO|nr:hypothetical protein [Cryobacterium sinapicolor]TFD01314.1 hypothetical protein E3T28_07090 [Cryobacterium sinapicolor]